MKKQVVRFKRETTIKDDICYEGKKEFKPITQGVSCSNCRVHIVTDRFLSPKFQKKVMKDSREFPSGTYPYVIIIDTAGCNLRCRACYSWIYWKPDEKAMACFVDEHTLAHQFRCKIEKINDDDLIKHTRMKDKWIRPFSRFRISGGEPLFNQSIKKDGLLFEDSSEFWLEFFGFLDLEMGELIKEKKINLCTEEHWVNISKVEKTEMFPCFLQSDNKKIRIRFDTNGEQFKNPEYAKRFIQGIYDLRLKSIKIDLTLSIKGSNSIEVKWFINANTEYNPHLHNIEEPLERHSGWESINNIVNAINEAESKDMVGRASQSIISETYYNPGGEVSLTIEKGIMNNPKENIYLYDKESLNWDCFAVKLSARGLKLSDTENRIYLGQFPVQVGWRYLDKGKYEFRMKCSNNKIHNNNLPFLSFSKTEKSVLGSEEHRQIKLYSDWEYFGAVLTGLKETKGKKCKYSNVICDYWIELVPVLLEKN